MRLESDPGTGKRHPILAGLEDAERIINGVSRAHTRRNGSYPNPPLTPIPPYPDLPMEEVLPRTPKTDIPEIYVREMGKGRIVNFPWDIDRAFGEVLPTDHLKLLRNAVDRTANEPRPVMVTGPGTLEVTIWRQKESLTVHLVNPTNPIMMKGPIREFVPTPAQNVSIRPPNGRKASKVHLLVTGRAPRVQEASGSVSLTIPSILDPEVVAIDLYAHSPMSSALGSSPCTTVTPVRVHTVRHDRSPSSAENRPFFRLTRRRGRQYYSAGGIMVMPT